MASIRLTVTAAPDSRPSDADPEALAALAGALREGMGEAHRLTRLGGLTLPGAPVGEGDGGRPAADRIFRVELPDGDLAAGVMRALGGWLMRHPTARLALKVDGPSGGVSLRLSGWSAVAYAAAVARIQQQLVPAQDR